LHRLAVFRLRGVTVVVLVSEEVLLECMPAASPGLPEVLVVVPCCAFASPPLNCLGIIVQKVA
jgi:hypothetical protein